jgi:hypothetical protein
MDSVQEHSGIPGSQIEFQIRAIKIAANKDTCNERELIVSFPVRMEE